MRDNEHRLYILYIDFGIGNIVSNAWEEQSKEKEKNENENRSSSNNKIKEEKSFIGNIKRHTLWHKLTLIAEIKTKERI